jgi:hypothetical protein
MGYNIGVRLVEDFLARTNSGKCNDFRETSEKIQLAFKVRNAEIKLHFKVFEDTKKVMIFSSF